MTNRYVKKHSTWLILGKYKWKPCWDIISNMLQWEDKRCVGKGVKKRKQVCAIGGNVNWSRHNGNQHTGPSKNLKIEPLYNPKMLLLGMHAGETKQGYHKIPVLLCSWQHYSQGPRYGNNLTSIDRWMRMGAACTCTCVLEYYSATGKKEILSLATTCMKLEVILSEISPSEKDKYCVRWHTCGI